MQVKHLIVGIDPGTTVGLAFLDMNGTVLKVLSERNLAIDGIISHIAGMGSAALVATDKSEVPPAVNKVASIVSARVFAPSEDLTLEKKRSIVSDTRYKTKSMDAHQTDALAAAVYAYNNFQNKLRRVEKQVAGALEETKARVLKGEKVADMAETWAGEPPDAAADNKAIDRLHAKIDALERENKQLAKKLSQGQQASTKGVKRFYEGELGSVSRILDSLRSGSLVFLRHVPSLTFDALKDSRMRRGDIIITENNASDRKGVRYLEAKGVEAVISPARLETLLPWVDIGKVGIIRFKGFFFADPKEIEESSKRSAMNEGKLRNLLDYYKSSRG